VCLIQPVSYAYANRLELGTARSALTTSVLRQGEYLRVCSLVSATQTEVLC